MYNYQIIVVLKKITVTYICKLKELKDSYLKLVPNPRDCCSVCANISYLRISLSDTERRAYLIASSK